VLSNLPALTKLVNGRAGLSPGSWIPVSLILNTRQNLLTKVSCLLNDTKEKRRLRKCSRLKEAKEPQQMNESDPILTPTAGTWSAKDVVHSANTTGT
jgi:hypothetical protein